MEKIAVVLKALGTALLLREIPGAKLPASHPLLARAEVAAVAFAAEVETVFPTLSKEEQETRARVGLVWAFWESRLSANPKGSNDQGSACGIGQVHPENFPEGTFPKEMTCKTMREDLTVSVRAELIAIRYFETKCGSLARGMSAYSTFGQCPPVGLVLKIVQDRCVDAVLSKKCEAF